MDGSVRFDIHAGIVRHLVIGATWRVPAKETVLILEFEPVEGDRGDVARRWRLLRKSACSQRRFDLLSRWQALEELFDGARDQPVHRDIAHLGVLLKPAVQVLGQTNCSCYSPV